MADKGMIDKLCIIGVGLIGSSLSLALKREAAVAEVIGYGRNQANLEKGMELGVLDRYETTIAAAVEDADVIVVAVPLGAMQAVFAEIAKTARNDAVITDVGSAKGSVVQAALAEFGDSVGRFVPGHPIAGGEQSGVEAGLRIALPGSPCHSDTSSADRCGSERSH